MPRLARVDVGNEIYHVINRANGRLKIFDSSQDYQLFEQLLLEAQELTDMRILAYVIMPNHWHLLLWPMNDGDLAQFMHRLSNTHTRRMHTATGTIGNGHLYQGRYKSFLVDSNNYLLTIIKYIERNPVRARLSNACEEWQWGSAWRRSQGTSKQKKLIHPSPEPLPHPYLKWINTAEKPNDLSIIRASVNKNIPFGRDSWVDTMISTYHLETTKRGVGRPRKNQNTHSSKES